MVLRSIIALIVALIVLQCYHDKADVPIWCAAMVVAGAVGQVYIVRTENLYPLCRAWLLSGVMVGYVLPLDFVKTDFYDIPTGYSCVVAFIGCLIAGLLSVGEGRSFWTGRRGAADAKTEDIERQQRDDANQQEVS